jgi:hypothetical protein
MVLLSLNGEWHFQLTERTKGEKMKRVRGSEKLLASWRQSASEGTAQSGAGKISRRKTVGIAVAAGVLGAGVFPASSASAYGGDDIPPCGNDILFWKKLIPTGGSTVPRVIWKGIPWPDRYVGGFVDTVNPAAGQIGGDIAQAGLVG